MPLEPVTPRRLRQGFLFLLLPALLLAGCDSVDRSGPGERIMAIVSPHGPEGAAVLRLIGGHVEEVEAARGHAFVDRSGGDLVVVLVNAVAGELALRLLLDDVSRLPAAELIQVAGPDNRLRDELSAYGVTFRRPER